jgi:arsenate reductase (thioredoxin)
VIAAALWERAGGRARAGGVNPAERIYPEVVEAMAEIGVDVTEAVPRPVIPADIRWADLVVTIDCTSEVDAEATTRTAEWTVPDVEEDPLRRMRAIRDAISEQVSDLADEYRHG